MVGDVGATGAAFLPSWTEHEVIDDKLAAAAEEVGEGDLAGRAFKLVVLLDFFPGQGAAQAAELIALTREFLFLLEKLLAGCDPFIVRNFFLVLE